RPPKTPLKSRRRRKNQRIRRRQKSNSFPSKKPLPIHRFSKPFPIRHKTAHLRILFRYIQNQECWRSDISCHSDRASWHRRSCLCPWVSLPSSIQRCLSCQPLGFLLVGSTFFLLAAEGRRTADPASPQP